MSPSVYTIYYAVAGKEMISRIYYAGGLGEGWKEEEGEEGRAYHTNVQKTVMHPMASFVVIWLDHSDQRVT